MPQSPLSRGPENLSAHAQVTVPGVAVDTTGREQDEQARPARERVEPLADRGHRLPEVTVEGRAAIGRYVDPAQFAQIISFRRG
ncbi:hypothetical protein SCATT_p17230 (plasmid) [Streptantibioticus cattleyicolor NRRL 8057 = DSM 46488]|uniref:Uncharacterized protein n=1 Tax=Streptantibioticus cattleyicolor (strain ATCC 35852 / DSM 46488 / JCM 4925 / NBRC 14057 / NRRL 8057) TaxID=1003195 RepID=G8XI10_STREN|nr:hypothetical protein SCATT_p17230 [Streptantibioticus cattleyicolor NRRL 8057 = DSM 46488]